MHLLYTGTGLGAFPELFEPGGAGAVVKVAPAGSRCVSALSTVSVCQRCVPVWHCQSMKQGRISSFETVVQCSS